MTSTDVTILTSHDKKLEWLVLQKVQSKQGYLLCHISVFKIGDFTDQLLSTFIKSNALRFIQDHFLVM